MIATRPHLLAAASMKSSPLPRHPLRGEGNLCGAVTARTRQQKPIEAMQPDPACSEGAGTRGQQPPGGGKDRQDPFAFGCLNFKSHSELASSTLFSAPSA